MVFLNLFFIMSVEYFTDFVVWSKKFHVKKYFTFTFRLTSIFWYLSILVACLTVLNDDRLVLFLLLLHLFLFVQVSISFPTFASTYQRSEGNIVTN